MSVASVHYVPAVELSPGDLVPQWGEWYSVISAELRGGRVKVWTESWGVMWFSPIESVRVLSCVRAVSA